MARRGVGNEKLGQEVGATEGGQSFERGVPARQMRIRIVPGLVVVVFYIQNCKLRVFNLQSATLIVDILSIEILKT